MYRVAVAIVLGSTLAIGGCGYFGEPCFELAPQSRLPKWFALPPSSARETLHVAMCYYVTRGGSIAKFEFTAADGKRARVTGGVCDLHPQKPRDLRPGYPSGYPRYEIVTVGDVTDIVEHRRAEPIFYLTDDPAVWSELNVARSR